MTIRASLLVPGTLLALLLPAAAQQSPMSQVRRPTADAAIDQICDVGPEGSGPAVCARRVNKVTGKIGTVVNNAQTEGDQSLTPKFIGQDPRLPAFSSSMISATTTKDVGYEFADAGQMTATKGSGIPKLSDGAHGTPSNYLRAKVMTYRAIDCTPTGGDCYAGNFLAQDEKGHAGNLIAMEADLNSLSGQAATTFKDLEGGLNVHAAYYAAGQSEKPISGGYLLNLTGGAFKVARAFGAYGGTVTGSVYDDDVTATENVMRSVGAKAGGIDFFGAKFASSVAFNMARDQRLSWSNGQTATQVYVDGANTLQLGQGASLIGLDAPVVFTALPRAPLHTPASSREACTAGTFADDENFHYVCVAKDRWKRVALGEF